MTDHDFGGFKIGAWIGGNKAKFICDVQMKMIFKQNVMSKWRWCPKKDEDGEMKMLWTNGNVEAKWKNDLMKKSTQNEKRNENMTAKWKC